MKQWSKPISLILRCVLVAVITSKYTTTAQPSSYDLFSSYDEPALIANSGSKNGKVTLLDTMDGSGLYFQGFRNASTVNDKFGDSRKSFDDDYAYINDDLEFIPQYVPTILRSIKVKVRVVDSIAEVTMVQEFQTPDFFPESLQVNKAVYQIPMDELAAVTEFRAEVDDRVIEAVVKEREEAEEDFLDATANGQNAYLAEQIRADIFQISVGNIPLKKIVRITLVYVTQLTTLGVNKVRFVFHTAIAQRYEPINNTEVSIPAGQDLINDGVQITLEVSMAARIHQITSSTHDIDVDMLDNTTATVNVTDENSTDRDVVISLESYDVFEPLIYVESSAKYNSTAIMLSIVPDISNDTISYRQEYIFVVDRSGSMSGTKIKQTREAMGYIIAHLPENSLFNIVGFGTEFEALFSEGSRQSSDETAMASAVDYVSNMDADFGGTELLKPLQSVLDTDRLSNYDRLVFVLTDGEVSNTDDVIEYVRSRQSVARVFALGIGKHVSALLVRGIARAGRGTSEFVDGDSTESIESAVTRQMEVATTPSLLDLTIQWGTFTGGQQAPYLPPPLLTWNRFLVFYLIEGQNNVPDTLRLLDSENDVLYEVDSSLFLLSSNNLLQDDDDNDLIHKIACRSLIRDLEEGGSGLHDAGATDQEIKDKIIHLGVKYQIASSETSFVAVDSLNWTETNGFANNDNGGGGGGYDDNSLFMYDADDYGAYTTIADTYSPDNSSFEEDVRLDFVWQLIRFLLSLFGF